ncbi:hypothetical protein GBN96_05165 [Bacillus sp. B4-WWTP-NA-D-NA-NA]|nr:hypothetical protein GBN96_05165 [Bacillus sp. B4-WWTP-NA-D-NA-NA]
MINFLINILLALLMICNVTIIAIDEINKKLEKDLNKNKFPKTPPRVNFKNNFAGGPSNAGGRFVFLFFAFRA